MLLLLSSLTRDAGRQRGVDTVDTTRSLKLALAEKQVEWLSSHDCPFEGLQHTAASVRTPLRFLSVETLPALLPHGARPLFV